MSLADVQVGDDVVRLVRGDPCEIIRVERVTATQIVAGGSRYRRSSGRPVGHRDPLWLVTAEDLLASAALHEAHDAGREQRAREEDEAAEYDGDCPIRRLARDTIRLGRAYRAAGGRL